jgi:hypothetical protein
MTDYWGEHRYQDPNVWASDVVGHVASTRHTNLLWADNIAESLYVVQCQVCEKKFCLPAYLAQREGERRLRDAFRTAAGKSILLKLFIERGLAETPPRTLWARLGENDF